LYEALTGRPPFRAETAAETVQQVIAQDPLPPSRLNSKVSRDLETICLKALHKEPRFRYATADALADDLDRFLRGETIAARPEGPLGRLTRRVRRRPMFSVAVSVVTLFTVALVGSGLGLLSERAATERAAKAEQAAAERSAEEDLQDMAQWLKKSSWPEATAALERAKVRLGDRGSSDLHNRIDQGARELALVERLDAIRLGRAISAVSLAARKRADEEYQAVFLDAGIAKVFENPEIVAERIKVLNVQAALTDALDDWHDCALDGHRLNWLLTVAGLADPDPASWRTRARVKKTWRNEAALAEMMAAGLKSDQCGPLLLGLARHWRGIWKDPVPFLVKVEQAHPEDLFANLTLAELLVITDKPEEAVRYYQAALAARPSAAGVYNNFGQVLGRIGRLEEAVEQLRRAVRFAPTSSAFRLNLALALNATGQCDEALEQGRRALGIDPKSATIHCALGDIQEAKGQHGEALAEYSQAIALEPTLTAAQQGLRAVLMRQGREEEARTAWQRALESNPPEHGAWYGYAEYCLFLGQENEYRRARQVLFEKYGKGRDMVITERTCRAYLLGPASGENLRQAVASAESIAAAEPRRYQGFYPYFLFVQGLGQYRQGHFDQAIATMRGDTSRVLGPAPRLVLAMALHRSGRVEEARQTLAAAILGHDWRLNQVHDQDDWIYHVLRREAEGLILPNLSAFLEGKYQPKDNDERLILLGVCQFTNRSLALSRLYADIFASAPQLAQGVRAGHRYNAACYAALAGCGRGVDAIGLGNPERRQCRLQARQWLRADLNAWSKLLEDDPPKTREMLRKTLTQWRETPELGGLRDPVELGKLPADEQKDCLAIWAEVGVVLNRCGSVK
jgi:serine/threonine-protein kinase